jgi:hypothetical protein
METNNVSPEKKSSVLNSLAIAGFIGIVLVLAWLSIQLVQLFPNAITSLASLAEGVNQSAVDVDQEEVALDSIIVTSNTSLVNTGETITINWDTKNKRGSYVFAYNCSDGVAVSQVENNTERPLACDTNYNVGDIDELTIAIESEKNRFTDVTYSIGFLSTNDTKPQALGTDIITIINEDVDSFTLNTDSEELANEEVIVENEPMNPVTETPAVATPVTQTPVFVQEFTYAIPTSNPNGFTDLATAYIAMGEVISNRFVPGVVASANDGAIQFSIKNFGTKTSDDWTFSVKLPNGATYESSDQEPLKPNERAVLTIGFAAGSDTRHTFEVEVDESSDQNNRNDTFSQRIIFAQ